MDIEAVRTFVAVADSGRFQEAAVELRVTQQAVSKRVASLERALGVTLFVRTARGARLTPDGQAFLPHAQEVLRTVERAAASVRPGERVLRVDVLGRRSAPALALRGFHRSRPGTDLDVVTLTHANVTTAIGAVLSGEVDATFRAVPAGELPEGISAERVLDDPLQLVVGPDHPLAAAASLTPAELTGHRIWIPGIRPGTEWGAYYDELTEAFDLRIDAIGPDFGPEALMDSLAGSAALATLVGSRDSYVWPAAHRLRRIPVEGPTPVYPYSFLYRTADRHPVLAALRGHLVRARPAPPADAWTPSWGPARA
ncbi:LysR family transcriptional regulator [Streptomyces sp. NBC_00249]|uniref:LysR family transcriptional regulator n=1 Tax=Streptomyces sp. NBC_00249 TaxID=2975690 RepID=UPI00224DC804|nr:LysR family transcriptional regulator [Streptomyces sp. NBC_00249]MCX5192460.1 LysR family transcriptional regulator [Streptomyces sp. NBC_00249]